MSSVHMKVCFTYIASRMCFTDCCVCVTMQATTLYCLVTEYASGGELLAYIKSQKDCRLGESASRPFIRQLLSAIFYLHERGIVHRYVSPLQHQRSSLQQSIAP